MSPSRTRPGFRLAAALGAAAVVAGAACATPRTQTPFVHKFVFAFQGEAGKDCRISLARVETATSCGAGCARVSRGLKDTVAFLSEPPGRSFEVVFDPFKRGPISVEGKGGREVPLDPTLPIPAGGKYYSFSVVAPGCEPLDPMVIIDR